mmetsp:Transcript_33172/g.93931  ORF Transcript_33172/g.93931 Transcript_33172/m.93931 type:complete len:1125 (+) Transcript_33172:118-3492(+)
MEEFLVVATGVLILILFLALALLVDWHSNRVREKQKGVLLDQQMLLDNLIASLSETAPWSSGSSSSSDSLRHAIGKRRQLAFVTTDLMESTNMAAADSEAFKQVQDIHDEVMRGAIWSCSGYEINTEGDAFFVAFRDVCDAVRFCMTVQHALLDTDWSKEVLQLPSCQTVYGQGRVRVFHGPRVRMGVHWAKEGTFSQRLHPLTKHRIFSGFGLRLATELGDAASGGQVLITHDAWELLRNSMARAGCPVISELGLFNFETSATPIWVYEVNELLNRPMQRKFGPPRGISCVESGSGHIITRPPNQLEDAGSSLTVVAVVPKFPLANQATELETLVGDRLRKQATILSMQFRGYIFRVNDGVSGFLVAFPSSMDGLRFCHMFQAMVMFSQWPSDVDKLFGPEENGPDGRHIFKGPRVAMVVHQGTDYEAKVLQTGDRHRPNVMDYDGGTVETAREVARITIGGQVLLTQPSWIALQEQLPGQAQALSIGVHRISQKLPEPMMLMQVMPNVLRRRVFAKLPTLQMLEPGYLSSPDPAKDMAIMFVKVHKPSIVKFHERRLALLAESGDIELGSKFAAGSGSFLKGFTATEGEGDAGSDTEDQSSHDDPLFSLQSGSCCVLPLDDSQSSGLRPSSTSETAKGLAIMEAYATGVHMLEEQLRATLKRFNGYECKEPDPGKFTLAFSVLEDAILFGAVLQEELLRLEWPAELLAIGECAEATGNEAGHTAASGRPSTSAPLPVIKSQSPAPSYAEVIREANGQAAGGPSPEGTNGSASSAHSFGDTEGPGHSRHSFVEMAIPEQFSPSLDDMASPSQSTPWPDSTAAPRSEPSAHMLSPFIREATVSGARVAFRGLRVAMGLAYGRPASRKPLNTGRADYFGNLPNTAARVMALAKPGQFLIEGSAPWPTPPFLERGGQCHQEDELFRLSLHEFRLPSGLQEDDFGNATAVAKSSWSKSITAQTKSISHRLFQSKPSATAGSKHSNDRSQGAAGSSLGMGSLNTDSVRRGGLLTRHEVVIRRFGNFMLKGLDTPKQMFQAHTPALSNRVFTADKAVGPNFRPSRAASGSQQSHRNSTSYIDLLLGRQGDSHSTHGGGWRLDPSNHVGGWHMDPSNHGGRGRRCSQSSN